MFDSWGNGWGRGEGEVSLLMKKKSNLYVEDLLLIIIIKKNIFMQESITKFLKS